MSDDTEQTESLTEQAKQWLLSLVGLDDESLTARAEHSHHLAVESLIANHPDLVMQHMGIEGVGRDQTLDPVIKERAYAALAGLGDHDVQGENVEGFGPADPSYTAGRSRDDDFTPPM